MGTLIESLGAAMGVAGAQTEDARVSFNHTDDMAANSLVKSLTESEDKLGGGRKLLELIDVGVKSATLLVVGCPLQHKRGMLHLISVCEFDKEPGLKGAPVQEAKGGGL
ncbi:hypothetical protein H0H92_005259 [Tricholoma furcatifolium]|nr:hypothetical protein H0H92_005259 [Tricholoma furcatifolium]